MFNKLPLVVMNILSEPYFRMQDIDESVDLLKAIVRQMEDTFSFYISQLETYPQLSFRFEGYFDLKANIGAVQWPADDPISAFRAVETVQVLEYILNRVANILPPLQKLVDNESGLESGQRADYSKLSAWTKTAIVAKAEAAVLMTNPSNFTPRVLTRCKNESNNLNVMEVPVEQRSIITAQQREWSACSYGANPALMRMAASSTPITSHSSQRAASQPMSRVLASMIAKDVFLPTQYIEHFSKVRAVFNKYSNLQSDEDSDDGVNDEDSGLTFFVDLDTDKFHSDDFTQDKANDMFVELAKVLISIYEKEWHYHLMVPKPRRSTQTHLHWPETRKSITNMPTTTAKILVWLVDNPQCTHINPPGTAPQITTESK